MHFKQQESGGGLSDLIILPEPRNQKAAFVKHSSTLPFNQPVSLSTFSGSKYATGQLLVQQVAYQLSDKIFSYSPDTFDLDVAVREWAQGGEKNIHGYQTDVLSLQTRTGAGAFALGYIFSKDFDVNKRHIPQTLLAPSLSLRNLQSSLDQLALLYGVGSPFVAHVTATEYSARSGLVAEYGPAMQIAEDLGLGLISSTSAYETQHMALFATIMARVLPTLHIYDGVRTSRETIRVSDVLSKAGIASVFGNLMKKAASLSKRLDPAGKTVELLKEFNAELGTKYEPFRYSGHQSPDAVFVVFGSVESQISEQVIADFAGRGVKVGVVVVRVYRPFVEEALLEALPSSVSTIAVFGQVQNESAVADASVQSTLFFDVTAAVSFGDEWTSQPAVLDVKYAASETMTPTLFASTVRSLLKDQEEDEPIRLSRLDTAAEYIFWDADDSPALSAPTIAASLLAQDCLISVHESFDNLLQGGVIRTDLRASREPIDAPYPIEQADVVFVNEEKLLSEIAVVKSLKVGGKLVLRLPNFSDDEIEKRLSASVRKSIHDRNLELIVLDPASFPAFENAAQATRSLVELAFLRTVAPNTKLEQIERAIDTGGNGPTFTQCFDALDKCLRKMETPGSWADANETAARSLPTTLNMNSFVPFDKKEKEQKLGTNDWKEAAKGLLFKEAYNTNLALRPDQSVKTYTIHVKENRRLTPTTYDRNIFHIEFDLGDSGLTYKIGEALGIHADNDPELVQEFIQSYGLDGDELVQIPSRDSGFMETRTIYQALVQNLDILGKPPKRFYEALAEFATDDVEQKKLAALGGPDGTGEFKKRSEVDTVTFADVLEEFKSAHPAFADLVQLVGPLKRREYSIASAQAVSLSIVALMIVVVDWVDSKGRTRYGQATRYLSRLPIGAAVTASVKPSVMKLPTRDDAPLIMAGLGTGLAPFRAFVQYRALQKSQGKTIGPILLYLGSRHQREEYLYGEEWEAYLDAGVITHLGAAFSRDQPQKIYIQDRMRQSTNLILDTYIRMDGSFYLCGPTWPVPDVTEVLEEAIETEARIAADLAKEQVGKKQRKVDPKREIERLKEEGRYVLEVY